MYINAPGGDLSPASTAETPQSVSSCFKKSRGPSQDFIYAPKGPHHPCFHLMPGLGAGCVVHLVIKTRSMLVNFLLNLGRQKEICKSKF